jgi:hypothetical protein
MLRTFISRAIIVHFFFKRFHTCRSAIALFEEAAKLGESAALYELGFLYRRGFAVPFDVKKAAMYFERASALGHKDAQWHLGEAYENGDGVEQSMEKAVFRQRSPLDICTTLGMALFKTMPKHLNGTVWLQQNMTTTLNSTWQSCIYTVEASKEASCMHCIGVKKQLKQAMRWLSYTSGECI